MTTTPETTTAKMPEHPQYLDLLPEEDRARFAGKTCFTFEVLAVALLRAIQRLEKKL